MAGRGRLSSIDLLPEEAADDIVWACQQLAERKRTQADILFDLNDRLEAKGLDAVSRSAFNRRALMLAAAQRRMQEARAMFEGLSSQFTAGDVDSNTIVLGEYLKTLIVELLGDEQRTPKQAMELATAFRSTVAAQKISSERRAKLEAEINAKTAKAVDVVAKARGLTAETAEEIKAKILGISSAAP